jgi:hypothetical protein
MQNLLCLNPWQMKDGKADARRNPISTEQKSVISGKTIDDLKKEY